MTTASQELRLDAGHRRWILLNAVVGAAVVNALSNAAIAWLSTLGDRRLPLLSVPFLQKPSTITDTLGTLFILPFLTTLAITLSVRRERRHERMVGPVIPARFPRVHARVPVRLLPRAGYFGALNLVILGPPSVIILVATSFGDISQSTFVLFKALLGIALGLVVTPAIALAAMTERE